MNNLRRYGHFITNWRRDVVCFRWIFPFSTFSTEDAASPNTCTVDYLVEKCGLPRERAMGAASCFRPKASLKNPESVLKFLKERGFSDAQIGNLLSQLPRLLRSRVGKNLKPKFDFFEELGFSRPDVVDLVLKDPGILWRSLENHLKPSVEFLRTQLGSDLDLSKLLKGSWIFRLINLRNAVVPHIELLRGYGVDDNQIRKLFYRDPSLFACNVAMLENALSRIEKLNAKFSPGMLIHAIYAFRRVSVTKFEAKCELWRSFGWSDEDIVSGLEKFPSLPTVSEEKIRALMEFFVNELGLKPKEIPAISFGRSLEKRIRPRHEILKIVQKWSGHEEKVNLFAITTMSDGVFFQRFVAPYDDKPNCRCIPLNYRPLRTPHEVVSMQNSSSFSVIKKKTVTGDAIEDNFMRNFYL